MRPFVLVILLALGWLHPALAQTTDDTLDLPALVDKELAARIDAELAPQLQRFSQHYGLAFPLVEPTKTIAEVQALIDAEIDQQLKQDLGIKPASEYKAEAEKLYAPVALKDEVTVETRSGGNASGILYDNNEYWIKVSNRRISKSDLTDESLARFDEAARARMVDQHVRRHSAKEKLAEDRFRAEKQEIWASRFYPKYGYLKQGDRWVSAIDFARTGFAKKRQELEAKYREYAENKVYLTRGYVKYGGRWMPIGDAKQKQLAEGDARAKAQAEAAALAVAEAQARAKAEAEAKVKAEEEAKARAEAEANAPIFPVDGAPPPGEPPPPEGVPPDAPPPPDAAPPLDAPQPAPPAEPPPPPPPAPAGAAAEPPAAPAAAAIADGAQRERPFEGTLPVLVVPDNVPVHRIASASGGKAEADEDDADE